MKFTDELTLLLKARYPIIYINTIEEDRVEYIIRKYIKTSLNRSIYSWDFIDGYTNNPNNEGFAKRNPVQALELVERLTAQTPALFLLKDFNRFLTDLSISRKLRNMKRADLQKKMEEAMASLRESRLDDVKHLLEEISDDIPSRHMTATPENQQETEEFLKKKHWWAQQDKVTIRDRGSSATTTFARSEDGRYYTQNQICVGEDRYWSDSKVPESHKNSDGIVLDPETHCYITEIYLYPDAAKFHCLTKRSYSDFFYNINTGYLQKSHEILEARL